MTMTGDFTFKDDGYIELVLRMLGLMCDNQHSDIQVKGKRLPKNMSWPLLNLKTAVNLRYTISSTIQYNINILIIFRL